MAANSKAPPKPSKPDPKKDARNALHVLAMQYQKAISSDHSVFTWPVCQRLFLELQNQASAAGVINLTKYMADALSWKDFQKDMKIKELSYKAESQDLIPLVVAIVVQDQDQDNGKEEVKEIEVVLLHLQKNQLRSNTRSTHHELA